MLATTRRNALALLALIATGAAHAAAGNTVDLLKYVPADTPYVIASLEPMPAKLADKFEPTVDEMLRNYQTILRYYIDEKATDMAAEDSSAEDVERFRGVAGEFVSLLSLEGVRGAGFGRNSAFAFYGNGLLPVIRLELTDTALFDAAIERIEAKAGESLSLGEANGKIYKFMDAEKIKLIFATLDDQAVITIVPTAFDEVQIARALGVTKPAVSLKKSATLAAIGREYDYSDYMIGYIDNERLARIFTGNGTDLDAELFAALDGDAPDLSTVCSSEIMDTVGVVPRMVFGYKELNVERLTSSMVVELRSDIAAGLATIPALVPGLGVDPGGFMSFGLGLDLLALRSFFESRLEAMEADPYECESLVEMNAGAARGRAALNQPLPPVVYSFKGLVANITDLECANPACDGAPESIDASAVLAVENAEALVMMAAMMDPQIAALNLAPGGDPVRVEMGPLASLAEDAFAAMSDNAIAVSLGANAEAKAADVLVAPSEDPAPFMNVSLDVSRYYSLLTESMADEPVEDEEVEPVPAEVRAAFRNTLSLSGNLYERMLMDVDLTKRGIEIGAVMIMSDE